MVLKCSKIILALALSIVVVTGLAQNNLKYRFSANSSTLLHEGKFVNILDPAIAGLSTPGGKNKFTPDFNAGFEMEISVPLSNLFSVGLEFERYNLSGVNKNPVYYNYFAEKTNKFTYHQEALKYTTSLNNLVVNVRYFPFGVRVFQPSIKTFGGVSFVGTNLQFNDPQDQINIFDPLFSRGTQQSTDTKWPAFYFGAGLGFEYHINNQFSIYLDASLSVIDTDIVDGVPNLSYNELTQINERVHTSALSSQISFGFCYSIYKPSKDSDAASPKQGTFKKRKGKIDKYFPFHEIKK